VEGIVQGVGFRPFVYTLASGLSLGGLVGNDADGVFAEVEGPAAAVEQFLRRLTAEAPPLAKFPAATFGILELNADPVLPLTVPPLIPAFSAGVPFCTLCTSAPLSTGKLSAFSEPSIVSEVRPM